MSSKSLLGAAAALGLVLSGVALAQSQGQGGAADDDRFLDVIVILDPAFAPGAHAANRAAARRIARGLGVAARFSYGSAVFGFAARIPEGRLQALENDPRVLYVDLDAPVAIPVPRTTAPRWCTPDSTHPACVDDGGDSGGAEVTPWGVDRIDADLNTGTGAGVHVYVIDTGIDADHPDLQAHLGNGYAVTPCKGGGCKASWDDDHSHGTHVAGTIGAIDNEIDVIGVAPEVTLHAVKVLNKNGSGTRAGVIAGVDWVAQQVALDGAPAVANMSLGGSGSKSGSCDESGFTGSDAYHEAICNAAHAGVVFAVAAGNEGADAEFAVPAAFDDAVITVTATSEADDWPSWSNWGNGNATDPNPAPVALAAPGVNVLSTGMGGGTATKSGTSMAAPHVAGALALYLDSYAADADYAAFTSARDVLLPAAEPTSGGTFANSSGHPHAEDFVDASGL
jgi:subtilisin